MTPHRPILEAHGLGKTFGRKNVLKAASFSAHTRRITALMGGNGMGKTTIFRIAVGRVRADHGSVLYQGRFLPRPSLARLARAGLMYSSQSSALTPVLSIRDHFQAFIDVFGEEGRFSDVIDELELKPFLDRRPIQISGGERQRASLGLAMMRSPACLLMDEPFAGVAPLDRHLVSRGLRSLKGRGTAVVISGHDVEDIFEVSDEIIWVTAGTTHWLGTPEEALGHDQFRREYLGPRRLAGITPTVERHRRPLPRACGER